VCKYRLKTINYSESIFTRYDITKYILNCTNVEYTFDEFGDYYFIVKDTLLLIPIIINEDKIARFVQIYISMPSFMKKDSIIALSIDKVIGFESDHPEVKCSVVILNHMDLDRFNVVDIVEEVEKDKENKENQMFENFKISDIKMVDISGELSVKLNGSVIKINDLKMVTIKSDNRTKTTDIDSFKKIICDKFKNKEVKDLTESEKAFLNESGLIQEITLVESNNIDDLLF